MTPSPLSEMTKALEHVELAMRECVFAAQEARNANGRDTYSSRVLDKASVTLGSLVSVVRTLEGRAEAAEARVAELEAEREAERRKLVLAWEALPGGDCSVRAVEKWLSESMAPVINETRTALTKGGSNGG